jgi:hypothetical protein
MGEGTRENEGWTWRKEAKGCREVEAKRIDASLLE